MGINNFSGSAEITNEGIKKHFKSYEPVESVFELVWNGLDANATIVDIQICRNALGGIESVAVIDNGDGIDVKNTKNNFEKFNESAKKLDDDKHGSHGKGRLAFHRLCDKAVWYTRTSDFDAKIEINSSTIKSFSGDFLENGAQHAALSGLKSGTCVELLRITKGLPEESDFHHRLSREFGWFLALNKSRVVALNGHSIDIPKNDLHETSIEIDEISFSVKLFRWHERPSSELSYNYLTNSHCKVINKELSKFNKKVKFHTSTYIFSSWIDSFDKNELEMSTESQKSQVILRKLTKELLQYQSEVYSDFLRNHVDEQINRFDREGYFPSYEGLEINYADWRKENTKSVLREVYLADPSIFNKINPKQAKILIRLLDKVLVSNENDGLFDVLEGVLDLGQDSIDQFAKLLKRTKLENIISTIEVLRKRQFAVHQLREVMEHRYTEVLETPDLQKIIENNTWLFGPQYATLGAEEDGFQNIAKNLRDLVKDIDVVSESDIADGATVDGVNRQVDLFLARKVVSFDAGGKPSFKCIIIEIKRPSISLNSKHLQQLDAYAEIISKHPAFGSERMIFELILIGRKISKDDFLIRQRIDNLKHRAEYGLVSDGRIKCYVKNWFTIFDEFDLSNTHLLSILNTKLDELQHCATESLITELQTVPV